MDVANAVIKQIESLNFDVPVIKLHINDAIRWGILDSSLNVIAAGVVVEVNGTVVTITKI